MANETRDRKKRKFHESDSEPPKRQKEVNESTRECTAGKIKRIFVRNFMCHDALEVLLNENVNFIVGRNGSGKSAILTALTVGLGARANVTSRGVSVKEFVKKGKHSAKIEITLVNEGAMAFKPELYGEAITVCRVIGVSSTYKIKNWRGEIISTKRDELDHMLSSMNIQIDNPISILNQDISRTFLISSKPEDKYQLFMRATRLDDIGKNYIEAKIECNETCEQLKRVNENLSKTKKDVALLKENIKRLENIDNMHQEMEDLQKELQWAMVISEEEKLKKLEENFKKCENNLKDYQASESGMETRNEEVTQKIQELQNQIKETEQEVIVSSDAYNNAMQQFRAKKETSCIKEQELQSCKSRINRFENNIKELHKEIQRLESVNNDGCKHRLTELEQKLDEVEAMLRTKQTDQMHLEADKIRLSQEMHSAKIEIDSCAGRMRKINQDLVALKRQSDDVLTVYGPNMPRLVKRIEEEHKKGRFKHKPCGPIGAYIKMKDPAWIPAVENYLAFGFLSSFCVDNSHDIKVLNNIMKEVFLHDKVPQIIASKFYNKIHNVEQQCIRARDYSNLLEAMDISNPVVANCLIDQREIECVLLIPTSHEASKIMSNAATVPRNCKRAITQQGDIFYPDPHYRSYGGKAGLRARFLQVSAREAIQTLEEELDVMENEKKVSIKLYENICEKIETTNAELKDVNTKVFKYDSVQSNLKKEINSLKEKLDINEAMLVTLHREEIMELEKKVQHEQAEEKRLSNEIRELQKDIETLQSKVSHYRDIRQSLNAKVDPLQEKIQQLKHEKRMLRLRGEHAIRKLQEARKAVEDATTNIEIQQELTQKAVADAMKHCSRIDTHRSVNEIKSLYKNLKGEIHEIEQQFGSKEELCNTLQQKEKKYGNLIKFSNLLEESSNRHRQRLACRERLYKELKDAIDLKVQTTFSSLLKLRNYKGSINIDHKNRILELKVSPNDNKERSNSNTKSLSGGERSYSTVAFILALWECTGLPFYFLDEFDVFMDKVNRHVIMDILLDHTKTHSESQFAFLTPLDTSHILPEDYITIHRLASPERSSQNEPK